MVIHLSPLIYSIMLLFFNEKDLQYVHSEIG